MKILRLMAVAAVLFSTAAEAQKEKKLPVTKNAGPKEQDIQYGREAAAQVEQQMYVVPSKPLTDYINKVGRRLVDTGLLDQDFPYTFKVVQEPSLNAFALPGGPMFVHTGLIAAAENEAQLAGVLAHELAHVSLRHGVTNASKQQTAAGIGAVAGAVLGGLIGGGLGQVAQAGVGMAAQGFAQKYSRSAESEADLLGSHVMAKAGYNPIELGRFFEKLEAEMGGDPGKVAELFASHPNPGNRSKTIEEQTPYMARGPYNTQVGDLDAMRKIVQGLPERPKGRKPGAGGDGQPQPSAMSMPEFRISATSKQLNAGGLSMAHPDNWQVYSDRNSGQLTIAPQEGLVQGGGLGAGVIVAIYQPQRARNLEDATVELLQQIAKQNQGQLKQNGQAQRVKVSGYDAILTKTVGPSPYQGQREFDYVVTVGVNDKVLYMIFVGPESRWQQFEPVYQEMLRSARISGN